jgi:hypothetical protein
VELPFRIKFSLKPKMSDYELQPSQNSGTLGGYVKESEYKRKDWLAIE